MNDLVKGYFYEEQLLKSPIPKPNDLFEVEKVLNTKTVRGKKYFLVKYLYYPNKFNQYIPEENFA